MTKLAYSSCLSSHRPKEPPLEVEHARDEEDNRVRVVDERQPPRVVHDVRERLPMTEDKNEKAKQGQKGKKRKRRK